MEFQLTNASRGRVRPPLGALARAEGAPEIEGLDDLITRCLPRVTWHLAARASHGTRIIS